MTDRNAEHQRSNLADMLAGLVPLAVFELRGTTFEQRRERVKGAADLIASQADSMMFAIASDKKPTGVLAAIVKGVATGAYQPGGATVLGMHACAHSHPGCPASAARPPCCSCDPGICTAPAENGRCPTSDACAWCANGCPAADAVGPCCAPTQPMGRLVLVHHRDG